MKLLYTSDIHASNDHLLSMLTVAEREAVDSIIIGGDLVPHYLPGIHQFGRLYVQGTYLKDVFIPAIRDFQQKKNLSIYLDLANDDFMANRKILEAYDGQLFNLLHMRKYKFTDFIDIIGYMFIPPTPFIIKDWEKPDAKDHPYIQGNSINLNGYISINDTLEETVLDLESEDTIEKDLSILSQSISGPFIFVAHCPPYNTPLDTLFDGSHVGSRSIRQFIAKWSKSGHLLASFHGHIHESPEISGSIHTSIEKTLCVNPGQGSGDGAAFQYVICDLTEDGVTLL